MKKFVARVSLFIGILLLPVVLVVAFAIATPPVSKSLSGSYLFAGKQKDFLLATVESPRIIFIGGSNLAFGTNSQMIKDSLGLNPVNTGLHASLGLKYMLDNTYRYIKKGDIVVVAPEYEHFY